MIGNMMIGRRRLLTLSATGISAMALGGLGSREARAADMIRWVSPRGTVEVLDDYPYWVAKKFGYFGDIETTLEPGPSDATATVKLVDQNQADVGYPSPGVFSLALTQGIPLVSAFHMGGADVFSFAFRKGEKPDSLKGLEGKTIVLGSAGWQSICDPMLSRWRRHLDNQICRCRLAHLGHGTEGGQGRFRIVMGRPPRPMERPGLRLRLLAGPRFLQAARQQLRHPQSGFR